MVSVAHFSTLVASIYRAAVDSGEWTATLAQIAQASGAVGCVMLNSDDGNSLTIQSAGTDPEAMRAYDEYYGRLDPVPAALDRLPVGTVVTREQAASRELLAGTEFFTDWVRPGGYADSMFAVLGRQNGATSWFATIGPVTDGDWSECATLLDALSPHLRQAIDTQSRIAGLERQNRDFIASMDAAADGLIVVGPTGAVRHANPAATRMLSEPDGLTLRHRDLHAAIQRALHGDPATGDCLQVRRAAAARPYIVRVVPLSAQDAGPRRGALLVVADPTRQPEPAPEALRRIYGLTRAEAEVALRVLNGAGLKPIAEELSMSLSTVRTHLQHVFDKTGTHRQAELVRLLLGGLSATRSPQSQPFG